MKKILIGLLLLTGLASGGDSAFDGSYWAMTYFKGKIEFSDWKKLGVNSCMIMGDASAAEAYAAGFPFYNEYVLPQIGWDTKVIAQYETIIKKYFTNGEEKRLKRKPSLSDPEYWASSKKKITELINIKKGQNPLAYCLGDECSVTAYVRPFDFDFSDTSLAAMRVWLKSIYGSVENLNAEWDTTFKNMEEVVPFTTEQAKERMGKGNENYSPWADHRTFMEISFADFLDKCRIYGLEQDAKTPFGIAGCQMPSCFGGYDWWRLSKVMTFVEAYDIGNNVDMIRSFTDNKKVFSASTVFGGDGNSRRKTWERFFQGERGTIIYDDSVNKGENKIATALSDLFLELNNGLSKKILSAERKTDPIALHYSQASIHAAWMLETGPAVRGWMGWSERKNSGFTKNREGWVKVIKDLGLQSKFVAYEQIENGELIKGGYKVFIMPESVAISAKEAKAIEEFVNAGGLVIADRQTATMDEHCKRLKEGQLDKLFGIKRGGSTTSVITNNFGKGKAVYLNSVLSFYPEERLKFPKERVTRDLVGSILSANGVKSRTTLSTPEGVELSNYEAIWFKAGEKEEYLAVLRNAPVEQDELGATKEVGNTAKKQPMRITLPVKGKIVDMRSKKELGVSDSINAEVNPYEPVIYSITWQ